MFVSSLPVTAITISAVFISAFTKTFGCEALPTTTLISASSSRFERGWGFSSTTTTSLSSCESNFARVLPTAPTPRTTIFKLFPSLLF